MTRSISVVLATVVAGAFALAATLSGPVELVRAAQTSAEGGPGAGDDDGTPDQGSGDVPSGGTPTPAPTATPDDDPSEPDDDPSEPDDDPSEPDDDPSEPDDGPSESPPAPTTRTFAADEAGQVTYRFDGASFELLAAVPTDGWTVEVEQAAGAELDLDFRRGTVRVQVDVEIEDGGVRERVRVRDDADDSETRIENGTVVRTEGPTEDADDDSSGPGDGDDDGDDDSSGLGDGDDDGDDNSGPGSDDDDSSGPGSGDDDDADDDSAGSDDDEDDE